MAVSSELFTSCRGWAGPNEDGVIEGEPCSGLRPNVAKMFNGDIAGVPGELDGPTAG
jgi:hypothetical protein